MKNYLGYENGKLAKLARNHLKAVSKKIVPGFSRSQMLLKRNEKKQNE